MHDGRSAPVEARAGAELIEATCGVVVPQYRWPVVHAELHRLGGREGPTGALRRLVAGDPDVREALVTAITIPETYLFRHPAHFRLLRRLAEERAQRGRATRVLSAGCSTGEEVWSAAAVLASMPLPAGVRHQVAGWDVSAERIEQARSGCYGAWSCRIGLLEYDGHFLRDGDTIRPAASVRRIVSFEQVNLLTDPRRGRALFDVVLLRNVAIYWRPPTIAAVWRRLAELLQPQGVFLVGPSDPVELPAGEWQQCLDDGARSYWRRVNGHGGATACEHPPAAAGPGDRRWCSPSLAEVPSAAPPAPPDGPDRAVAPVPPSSSGLSSSADNGSTLERVRILADAGRYHEALALLVDDPAIRSVAGKSWCAILQLALENTDEAIRLFRQCVFLEPDEPTHRRWLAAAYETAGMTEEASRERRNVGVVSGP